LKVKAAGLVAGARKRSAIVVAAAGTGVECMPRRNPPSTLCCSEVMNDAVDGCVQVELE
jgi:hypothetical protein